MKISIPLEQDSEFRKYVRDLIEGQVKAIVREELSTMIQNEVGRKVAYMPLNTVASECAHERIKYELNYISLRKCIDEAAYKAVTERAGTYVQDQAEFVVNAVFKNIIKDKLKDMELDISINLKQED